ncbi:MAG TPA: hypothetical protein VNZ48_01670 [Xanthobacteraceae bacterium]|jgi:hypothetical protein|nr:hypothetical protein [Xanthobacteraceae bacterium]
MSCVSDQVPEDGVFEDVRPACVALVPVAPSLQFLSKLPLPRPDPTFVTHLIASAEQVPQARRLRRATSADADLAYAARPSQRQGIGFWTRQLI